MWDATVRSVEIVPEIAARENIDARIVRGGMAALGTRADSKEKFEKSVSWYRKAVGVDWEVLGPERVSEVVSEKASPLPSSSRKGLGSSPPVSPSGSPPG